MDRVALQFYLAIHGSEITLTEARCLMGGGEFMCPEKSGPQHVNRYVSLGRKEEESFQEGNKKAQG